MTLKHVSFQTDGADAVISFYRMLGAVVLKDAASPDGLRRVVLGFQDGGKLQFFEAPGGAAPRPAGVWMEHVALELPDLHSSVSALQTAGVKFARELSTTPTGNPVAFVLDPDGRHVELLQAGPR